MTPNGSATLAKRRYLALWFPYLAAERLRLASPSSAQAKPLVFVARERNSLLLAAVCARAEALGLAAGLALADARARIPDIDVVEADTAADSRLLIQLADRALRWSPTVSVDHPDGLIIETSASAHLFGGECGLAGDVEAQFGRTLTVRKAFASTPPAARALARYPSQGLCEADAIARLPVAALGLARESETALRRAGLKRIADLASRPTGPLVARFGQQAALALDRLLGRSETPLVLHRTLPMLQFSRRFAEPVGHSDAVLAALARLAGKAMHAMEARALGGRSFTAWLFRTDGAVRDLVVETGRPTRDADLVMRLLKERIEALADPLDPGFGYDFLRLEVTASEPLLSVQPHINSPTRSEESLSRLIDRLSVRYGRGRIRRFLPVDTHVPERAVRTLSALDMSVTTSWPPSPAGEPPLRPVLLFDPPQPIETIAEVPDAPPRRFRWRGQNHDVIRAEGPERIAAPWWQQASAQSPTRDYYRAEDSEGQIFWLFRRGLHERETMHPRWYIHGLFA